MRNNLVVVSAALPITAIVEIIIVVEEATVIISDVHLMPTATFNAMHAALLDMVLDSAKALPAPSEF